MNENKRINNPQIKVVKCIGTEAQDRKMCWNFLKTNNGNNFQNKKFSVIDLGSLLAEENISGTWPKSACDKSSSCQFLFSAARDGITKATEYITFSFSFCNLVFFPF